MNTSNCSNYSSFQLLLNTLQKMYLYNIKHMLFVPHKSVFRYFQQLLWKSRNKKKSNILFNIKNLTPRAFIITSEWATHGSSSLCDLTCQKLNHKGLQALWFYCSMHIFYYVQKSQTQVMQNWTTEHLKAVRTSAASMKWSNKLWHSIFEKHTK